MSTPLSYTRNEVQERLEWAEQAHDILGGSSAGGIVNITSQKVVSAADASTTKLYMTGVSAANAALKYNSNVYTNCSTGVLYGAAWNDYAEYREVNGDCEPGQCMVELGNGQVRISNSRLEPFAGVVSDTYGMCIGIQSDNSAPLAMSGRVMVYTFENRSNFKPGDCVCSGPNGTISIMSREEIKEYPDRIVGIVSEIPEYELWDDRVSVKGRIWIKVR